MQNGVHAERQSTRRTWLSGDSESFPLQRRRRASPGKSATRRGPWPERSPVLQRGAFLPPNRVFVLTHYKKGRPFKCRLEASAQDRRKGAPKWTIESILAWTYIRQASRLRSLTPPARC